MMMVRIGQRDDAVVNLMMGGNGHRDHAVGDDLEWADRLSVLALPAARSWMMMMMMRSWERKRIFTDCSSLPGALLVIMIQYITLRSKSIFLALESARPWAHHVLR